MYATHRNGRDDLIKQQGKQHEQVMSDLQEKATKSEKQLSTLKGKVDCLRHRAAYWKSKYMRKDIALMIVI